MSRDSLLLTLLWQPSSKVTYSKDFAIAIIRSHFYIIQEESFFSNNYGHLCAFLRLEAFDHPGRRLMLGLCELQADSGSTDVVAAYAQIRYYRHKFQSKITQMEHIMRIILVTE